MKIKRRHLKYLIERYLFEQDEDDENEPEAEKKEEPEEKIEKLDYEKNSSNQKQEIGNEFRALYQKSIDDKLEKNISYEISKKAAEILDIEEKNGKSTISQKDIKDKLEASNNNVRIYTTA